MKEMADISFKSEIGLKVKHKGFANHNNFGRVFCTSKKWPSDSSVVGGCPMRFLLELLVLCSGVLSTSGNEPSAENAPETPGRANGPDSAPVEETVSLLC